MRNSNDIIEFELIEILTSLKKYTKEWLLPLEIFEMAKNIYPDVCTKAETHLQIITKNNPQLKKVISDGLKMHQ